MASAAAAAPAPYAPPPEHHEDDVDDEFRPVKEFTVFLVDAGAAMLQPCFQHLKLHPGQQAVEGVCESDSWLDVAVKVVRETLAAKIVAAPATDEAAVVFYGPRVARGPAPDDEPQVWTFNLGLEARRNAARGVGGGAEAGGGGVPVAAAASAKAKATAVARQAHDASGIDFPSADLLRALAELVGDGDGGEGGGVNRARERLFVGGNNNGNGRGGQEELVEEKNKEEPFEASVEALLLALRRASTLLSGATRGKRPGTCAQRVVVLSCQPLEFRSLFPAVAASALGAGAPGSSPSGPTARSSSSSLEAAPFLDAAVAAAATFATAKAMSQLPGGGGGFGSAVPATQQQQLQLRLFADAAAARRARALATQLRCALRERGGILGGACASVELVAMEPLSSVNNKRSTMAGGAVEEEEEGEDNGGGGDSSAAADFYGDAGQQRTAWGELLLASAAAARREAEDAGERAIRAARQVAEEELKQQQEAEKGKGNGTEQSQHQQLVVATLRLRQLQSEAEAARVAEFADDAAVSLAVTRFSGVARAARAKVYRRRALSTYFLLLPGGSNGGGEGDGDENETSSIACAVSLYQNLRKAWYASAEIVSLKDYAPLAKQSKLVPVGPSAAGICGAGPSSTVAAPAAAAAAGGLEVVGAEAVRAFRLGGERAGARDIVKRLELAAVEAADAGFSRSVVSAETARKTVAGGVVEFSGEELARAKCVGFPLEEGGEEMEEGGEEEMEEQRRAAAVAAGLYGLNRNPSRDERDGGGREHDGDGEGGEGEGGGEEEDDDELSAASSSPSFIEVLGFVPVSMIDPKRLQRAPSFLYPNERFAKGSTPVFYSLWWAMLGQGEDDDEEEGEEEEMKEEEEGAAPAADGGSAGKKKKKKKKKTPTGPFAALATFVRKRGRPQLVALVPHALVVDAGGSGEQLEPPGLDVIYLPAADECRPAAAPNAGGLSSSGQASQFGLPPYLAAGERAVSAAERLVRGLCLDEVVKGENEGKEGKKEEEEEEEFVIPFDSSEISNPALARFYSVLEALALGEEVPDAETAPDGTMPSQESAQRAAALARGLAEAVGGALDDGEYSGGGGGGGGGAGSGGGGGGGASAKARRGREATVAEIEADALAGLDLTVTEAQRALVARGLKKSGGKADVLQRLRGALGGGRG